MKTLDEAIAEVVANDNCSGCGACVLLDDGIQMITNSEGYARPERVRTSSGVSPTAAERFHDACPGRTVRTGHDSAARRHPTMGPVVQAWKAWATDGDIRFRGSSGGTLTALSAWLVENGEVSRLTGAAASPSDRRRTVTVQITTREEALRSAGSRYAPVSNASAPSALDPSAAFVGKPCEASAIRALSGDVPAPIILSFFCAGTPSQAATDRLADSLMPDGSTHVTDLWYRGRGWPGNFTVVTEAGEGTASYDESWGKHLGPTTQWRCKICPDGVGESADVVAADFWNADENGYPDFGEGDGVSALIARTRRGQDVVLRALAAGVLAGESLNLDALAEIQPLQVNRHELLAARLAGTIIAGGSVPRFTGFSLIRLALRRPRLALRTARGTYRRVRARRRGPRS